MGDFLPAATAAQADLCRDLPVEDELFKRAVLRAAPAIVLEADVSAASIVFFDKELGRKYGDDIHRRVFECARHIIAGECAIHEFEVTSHFPPRYLVRRKGEEQS
jgi:hypothetical protein